MLKKKNKKKKCDCYVVAVLKECMDVMFEKKAHKLAEETMRVIEEHGENYEAPAWRQLMARAEDMGMYIQML